MAREKTETFNMRVSPDFLRRVDEWRRQHPDIPPRAEAIRLLVIAGLALEPLMRHSMVRGRTLRAIVDELRAVAPDKARAFDKALRADEEEDREMVTMLGMLHISMPSADAPARKKKP